MMLGVTDGTSQGRIARLVFPSLVSASMSDIKKPVRDASLDAIRDGFHIPQLAGGGFNKESVEALMFAVSEQVNETTSRAIGLPDILQLLCSLDSNLPDMGQFPTIKGSSFLDRYCDCLMACLTSSKSETRAAATNLLDLSIGKGLDKEALARSLQKLKPANQRTVGGILAQYQNTMVTEVDDVKQVKALPPAAGAEAKQAPLTGMGATKGKRVPRYPEPQTSTSAEGALSASKDGAHPLAGRSRGRSNAVTSSLTWPEYPEEPSSNALASLKKHWGSQLPATSLAPLFPSTGFRKQDDATDGCSLLGTSIEQDQREGTAVCVDHLSFIFRWIVCALCAKESTVGLQAVLSLVRDTLAFLTTRKVELPDSDVSTLIPFLVEKSSIAKGRFRDSYHEIMELVGKSNLLSPKQLGATVAVLVLERSVHAKARTLACQLCLVCVNEMGLNAIGKKGVIVTSKCLSEESMPETKMAALDLMELVATKMSRDTSRLAKICGPSLSTKALHLVDERLAKNEGKTAASSSASPGPSLLEGTHRTSPAKTKSSAEKADPVSSDIRDELPALSLRGEKSTSPRVSSGSAGVSEDEAMNPFSFSARLRGVASPTSTISDSARQASPVVQVSPVVDRATVEVEATSPTQTEAEPIGAAAALRARLLRIRERTVDTATSSLTDEAVAEPSGRDAYKSCIDRMSRLCSRSPPLEEFDDDLFSCIESLKQFHSAVSTEDNLDLRHAIEEGMDDALEGLTRYEWLKALQWHRAVATHCSSDSSALRSTAASPH